MASFRPARRLIAVATLLLLAAAVWRPAVLAATAPAPAPAPQAEPRSGPADGRSDFAATICGEMQARAAEHALPEAFIARLIWKESLFDPAAVSPKGAQGIAQFMPETARRRGLADPFEPAQALAASAAYLAELRDTFGNLGRAAAAYNAGEERVRRWLSGDGGLPYETQDYVLAVTGRGHEAWKAEDARFDIPAIAAEGSFAEQCVSLVLRQRAPRQAATPRGVWKPWGVVLAGGFSESRALEAFARIRARHDMLAGEEPLVLRKRNLSMGRRRMVQVMVGRDSRKAAETLCGRIAAQGGACMVEKN